MKKFYIFISLLFFSLSLNNNYCSTQVDFLLTLSDGVKLDCTKFIPDGNPPSGGWPCIIMLHGFGLDKYSEIDYAEDMADNDFYTVVYSMRGQGESQGYSNLISTTEMYDFISVIQYVMNDANTNDSKIGAIGGSQGGIIPFMAACYNANLKCVAPDLATPDFGSNWIENGSIKMTLLWTLSYGTDIVRYNNLTKAMRTWILSSQKDKWDSLAYYMPLNRDFSNKVNTCNVPVFSSNAWQDKFFSANGIINALPSLHSPYRMYWGSRDGHGSDESEEELEYQSGVVEDWFDYWLKGMNNGVMDANKKFVYASTVYPRVNGYEWSFEQSSSSVWPPAGINSVKLYFHPNFQLLPVAYSGSTSNVILLNDVKDPTLTMEQAVNYEFTGSVFESRFGKQTLSFVTPWLTQSCKLAGIPKVSLYYSSDADLCQYNFQIWEIHPDGTTMLVNRINWTDRAYTVNTTKQKTINGVAHSHIFTAGSRIKVVVTNLDNLTSYENTFLRTNPYVLPVLKRANNKIFVNGSSQSYIELPLTSFAIGVENISSDVPKQFSLHQNYPNPFNPNTLIKYELRMTGNVKLVVYDITGKEISTLINQKQNAGTYQAAFNGDNLPSGVYFYKLITDGFTDVKKMILVK
ncbi:MAG: alpha/beta fold hydrolase [Ignavibacteriae bacterium]|nr:MAG: alpha/beta fold hydrolase [Ignavibacteriota bacterium]